MQEPVPGDPLSRSALPKRLHEIARLLREAHNLGPEAQLALADLTDELGNTLGPSAETSHLADSTAHLIETLNRKESSGKLAAARDKVEQAVLAVEAKTPLLAGVTRRLLEALGSLGI